MSAAPVYMEIDTIQPFFVRCADTHLKMTLRNSPVAHFYSFTADMGVRGTIAVPDGCVDILFACGPSDAESAVCGTVTAPTDVPITPGATYFGVRYHPGVTPYGIGLAAAELVDNRFRLSDAPEWRRLAELIAGEPVFRRKADLFLKIKGRAGGVSTDGVCSRLSARILGLILEKRGAVSVSEMEAETGYSARYIDKAFCASMGVSPKTYCRFIRFQTLLRVINGRGGGSLMSFAVDSGFYDHSHMLRDFKAFTSFNPSEYMSAVDLPAYRSKIIDVESV